VTSGPALVHSDFTAYYNSQLFPVSHIISLTDRLRLDLDGPRPTWLHLVVMTTPRYVIPRRLRVMQAHAGKLLPKNSAWVFRGFLT